MTKSLKVRSLVMSCVLLVCASLYSACGVGNVVRPDQISANQAIGEEFACTPEKLKGQVSPFAVNWSDNDRATLETEMASGIALVRMTCEGVEVLSGCSLPGGYSYSGLASKKETVVSMNDMGSVKANIGGTANLPSEFSAEMSQGRALTLGYMMIGAQNTTVRNVIRDSIEDARCKGATHFVFQAKVGAFAMETREQGEAKAKVSVLGYGSASGEAGSEKGSRIVDGDPESCQSATSKDKEGVEGCQALVRLALLPVAEGKILGPVASGASADTSGGDTSGGDTSGGDTSGGDTSGGEDTSGGSVDASDLENLDLDLDLSSFDAFGCPEGMVYQDDFCQYPSQVTAYLCDEGDLEGCRTQCSNGSKESCGRFSSALLDKHYGNKEYLIICDADMEAFFADAEPLRAKIDEACENADGPSCSVSALILDIPNARAEECTGEPSSEYALQYATKMDTACSNREQRACRAVADIYGEGEFSSKGIPADALMLDLTLGLACDSGNARACWLIGELYVSAGSTGVAYDMEKSLTYLRRACFGDNVLACAIAGIAAGNTGTDLCISQIQELHPHFNKNYVIHPSDEVAEFTTFCEKSAPYADPNLAYDLLANACKFSGDPLASATCDMGLRLLNFEGL